MDSKMKSSYLMTFIIVMLTLIAAAGGLFIDELYKDTNSFALSAWYANDIILLTVGLPLLIAALVLSIRGSLRGQLVWLGMLNFTIYNYSYYLFGAALNAFFSDLCRLVYFVDVFTYFRFSFFRLQKN